MTLTVRDLDILRFLRRYFYLRTNQIRDMVAPHDKDGSITRGRLRKLVEATYIRRYQPKLIDPTDPQTAAPIFVLTLTGSNVLATMTGDARLALTIQPAFSDWMSLSHFCFLASLHRMIDEAMSAQERVKQLAVYFEHEVVQPDAKDPSKKYRLHMSFNDGEIKCCPDSAIETEVGGYRRAWYVEREMGSDNPSRVAAKKHKGYVELARTGEFKRHFPHARDFRVLAFCPNGSWRDSMKEAMKTKTGAELWLFCATPDVKADTFLHAPIFWTVDKGPIPFVPVSKVPVFGILSGMGSGAGESEGEAGGGGRAR